MLTLLAFFLGSCDDGKEVSPKKCHELGLQYAKELFGDDFQFIVATHLNTDNVHNHIVVNSVSFKISLIFFFPSHLIFFIILKNSLDFNNIYKFVTISILIFIYF